MKTDALKLWLLAALICLSAAAPSLAQTCRITGPSDIGINQRFTLCGPTGSDYTYEWYGPGIESQSESRCVTARLANVGTYEFVLVLKLNDDEVGRCTKVVNAGGSTGGSSSCAITGPQSIRSGASARLCAPNDGLHSYRWTGPNGFTATSACITVQEEGTYYLTSRNPITGSTRQCTHHLAVTGQSTGSCDIVGPTTIAEGASVELCAPRRSNTSYRWTGPNGFTGSARCITADAAGTYSVRIRDLTSGRTESCSQVLSLADGGTGDDQDPDEVVWDNCPRNLQFWRRLFDSGQSGAETNGLTQSDLRAIARRVDERSTYFNWSNDLDGLRQALNPVGLTRRKQVARQFAALMANVAAGELNVGFQGRESIGLDPDTRVNYPGASTLRDLVAITDRMLRANRGNYAKLNATLTAINSGRGIGPVCE
jgi:hypothetical protein